MRRMYLGGLGTVSLKIYIYMEAGTHCVLHKCTSMIYYVCDVMCPASCLVIAFCRNSLSNIHMVIQFFADVSRHADTDA